MKQGTHQALADKEEAQLHTVVRSFRPDHLTQEEPQHPLSARPLPPCGRLLNGRNLTDPFHLLR